MGQCCPCESSRKLPVLQSLGSGLANPMDGKPRVFFFSELSSLFHMEEMTYLGLVSGGKSSKLPAAEGNPRVCLC